MIPAAFIAALIGTLVYGLSIKLERINERIGDVQQNTTCDVRAEDLPTILDIGDGKRFCITIVEQR